MNIPSFTHAAVDRMIAAITREANCAYRDGRLPNTSRALEHFKRADKSGLSDQHATLLFEVIMYLSPSDIISEDTKSELLRQSRQLQQWLEYNI
jgi:hypothetical protein